MRIVLLCLLIFLGAGRAQADVRINQWMNQPIYSGSRFSIPAGGYLTQEISLKRAGIISLKTHFSGKSLSALICDKTNYRLFQADQNWQCFGVLDQQSPISLNTQIDAVGTYYVVWDNRRYRQTTHTIQVWLDVPDYMAVSDYRFVQKHMNYFDRLVKYTFKTGEIGLRVEPCGEKNAFTGLDTGAITMCTELFEYAIRYDNLGVIYQIFFHELGHSLLAKLGLPGATDESLVDEFSVYMMLKTGTYSLLPKAIEYWLEQDSATEAELRLTKNIKHPVSIQRARNMADTIKEHRYISSVWNNLLYPHLTIKALEDARNRPALTDDPKLADRTLREQR